MIATGSLQLQGQGGQQGQHPLLALLSEEEWFQREVVILRACRDANIVQFLVRSPHARTRAHARAHLAGLCVNVCAWRCA